jgi:hypothetical protein
METKTKETYPRSVGEILRKQDESMVVSPTTDMTNIQISNFIQLTIVEAYFSGMVGESICCRSYFITDISEQVPKCTPINTPDELRVIYNKTRGKRNRIYIWACLKEFNGWSEDPIPYII